MIFEPLPVTNLHPQNIRVRDWMRDSDFEKLRKCLRTVEKTGSGRGCHLCPEEDSDPTEVTVRYQKSTVCFGLFEPNWAIALVEYSLTFLKSENHFRNPLKQ